MAAGARRMSRVVVFAFDLEEASQIRAIRSMLRTGAHVSTVSFRRGQMHSGYVPEWEDISLGHAANGTGRARLRALARAATRIWRAAPRLRDVDLIFARNLDMALLALWLRLRLRRRIPVVYQCLDIHRVMSSTGLFGAVARWAERRVLARCLRVVISAPAFATAYFRPVQGYSGEVQVLENRIAWNGPPPPRPRPRSSRSLGPLVLGWVGTLRCPESWHLLCGVAEVLGPERVQVRLRGVVHTHQLLGLAETIASSANIFLDGPYQYPKGLGTAYRGLEAVWAQDLWQRGKNSDWLLPNRIYEAAYFGCPAIAVAGTATGNRIEEAGSGLTLSTPTVEALADLLVQRQEALGAISAQLLTAPCPWTCQNDAEISRMLRLPDPQEGNKVSRPLQTAEPPPSQATPKQAS